MAISAGPPPSKKRKISYTFASKSKSTPKVKPVEDLTFDVSARQDYLTGFHKRKVQRSKAAAEENAKKEREERVKERRQLREQRKQDLEAHVAEVNALLRKHNPDLPSEGESDQEGGGAEGEEEWGGIAETALDGVDEYVDEDKYTTVTIETMDDAKAFVDGNKRDQEDEAGESADVKGKGEGEEEATTAGGKRKWTKERPAKTDAGIKKKKKKFRYESKAERQQTRRKQKSRNAAAAKERKAK